METDDFYVVVVENEETDGIKSEPKLTVDLSDNERQSVHLKTINDNHIDSNDACNTIISDESASKVKLEKKEMDFLLDVIKKKSYLPSYDYCMLNEIKSGDKQLNSILQIECPKKKTRRIFKLFKETLIKNEFRSEEPLDKSQYAYSDGNYMCNFCDHASSNENMAIKHYRFIHGPRVHYCLACKAAYRRHDSLLVHERSCVSEWAQILREARAYIGPRKTFIYKNRNAKKTCPKCGKLIPRNSMKKHLDYHAGITVYYECNECARKFLSKYSLKQHILKHGTTVRYQCDQCPRSYVNARGLKRHQFDHQQPTEASICDICGREFVYQSSLQQHILNNHSEKPYILCQLCGKSYKQRTSFRRHRCQPGVNTPVYQCGDCNIRFITESVFVKHVSKKHGLDASMIHLHSTDNVREVVMHSSEKSTTKKTRKYNRQKEGSKKRNDDDLKEKQTQYLTIV